MTLQSRTFRIAGMHCASCAISIDWELEDLDGVVEAKTSYADNCLKVVLDPLLVGEAEIMAAVVRAGFAATPEEG